MTAEYTMTRQMAKEFTRDYIFHLPKRRKQTRWIAALSVLIALVYVSFEPATWTINDQQFSVILIWGVQVPLCALLLFCLLRFLFDAPIRAVLKSIDESDDANWGERKLNVADNEVQLNTGMTCVSYNLAFVDSILTTACAHHLESKAKRLMSIPISVISRDELECLILNSRLN